ncbi:uncharacterized protein PpBr36_10742 [Pyricularia pennisetigena]|uniref:uncharacterized protein n=1 Tax=Pyricularia pennisetigena TaxID=1578925 RepID=UPI00114E72BB|nr:uncharacterized protein PpBr36_10742 [Pyricularia pennisetigena]TLS21014.1 hypothetical protein PpBr36_10742 [Pyricularia pennisetigena]
MLKHFLDGGQARIKQTLQRGYAPPHFAHNLELILVEDSRSPTSMSMRSKLASTRERIARLRTLDPVTLIWWTTAFPMRQWSGGRNMSSRTFAALVRRAPDFAAEMEPLLGIIRDELKLLAEVHKTSRAVQDLLLAVSRDHASGSRSITPNTDVQSPKNQYVVLTGAQPQFPALLPHLLRQGVEASRKYQQEKDKGARLSTAIQAFIPTVPMEKDAYVMLSIGSNEVWGLLHELGILDQIVKEPKAGATEGELLDRIEIFRHQPYRSKSDRKWGPVLIVGGSGRLGYFIARELLQQPECDRVVSISRSSAVANACEGVEYRVADIRDGEAVAAIMAEVRPETIINSASPPHTDETVTSKTEFEEFFGEAQEKLLAAARRFGSRYLVFTSSSSVIQGYNHYDADETAPMWPENSRAYPYWVQRAKMENRLLAADSPELQSVALRLPLIVGERDYAFVPSMVKALEDGQTGVQIGSGYGKLTTVSADDAARAHVLALRGLMRPGNDVHGEAFYIIGKKPVISFQAMARVVWVEAGWKPSPPSITVPDWAAKTLVAACEMITWPLGITPPLTVHMLRIMCNTWTYNDTKARERLGYVPRDDTVDALRKGTREFLANRDEHRKSGPNHP